MTTWIDASFVRGGTSKGLCFRAEDLPGGLALPSTVASSGFGEEDHLTRTRSLADRDAILCAAMGSPDAYGRQLDGMGGGISSLSKAMIVGRSDREGVDLDYTFAQIEIGEARVDYSGNCGNLSSAVVPFALAAGIIEAADGPREFTLFNTNTDGIVKVRLVVLGGQAAVDGDLALPGVAGQGSPVELVYPSPGGSRTAGVLPTGNSVDVLTVPGPVPGAAIEAGGARAANGMGERREVRASLVDAAIPLVLVRASDFGLTGAESPEQLDADAATMELLESVRREGAVRMGLCETPEVAPQAVPKITLVAPPIESRLLDGSTLPADASDVLVRAISMGQAHRAVPGTGAMCLAAAAAIGGSMLPTLVAEIVGKSRGERHPAGPAAKVTGTAVTAGADGTHGAEGSAGTVGTDGTVGTEGTVRLATPSGVVTAAAVVASTRAALPELNRPLVIETSLARTARVLMRGQVAVNL